MIHIPGLFVYVSVPRTYGSIIEPALIQHYPDAVKTDVLPVGERVIASIRNPFSLVLEWYQCNPEWKNLLQFIRSYEHSHFVREGTLFWGIPQDADVIRDEKPNLEDLGIEVELPPIDDYRNHYGPDEVAAVQARFANDLELFDYNF